MQASDTWKRRFEEAVREATKADEHAAASASAPTATAGAPSASDAAHGEADDNAGADRKRGHRKTWSSGGDADDAAKQLAELTAEYGVYRKRALEIIAKKDQELQELHAVLRRHQGDPARSYQGQSAGAGAGGASSALGAGTGGRSTSEFGTGASGFSESGASRRLGLRDGATQEYLKNVLMRYMLTSDPAVRVQLESAIAAVMGFSAVEMQRVKVRCLVQRRSAMGCEMTLLSSSLLHTGCARGRVFRVAVVESHVAIFIIVLLLCNAATNMMGNKSTLLLNVCRDASRNHATRKQIGCRNASTTTPLENKWVGLTPPSSNVIPTLMQSQNGPDIHAHT